ncbi:hypothetical protein M413DRAFT_390198 [Hebeloma cylindrosporum]|uniref:Uncharacterized protein n=1 Tax=Hebeloma cylindrosporum TaxID=76867 RepID=A0A0C3CJD8_HEBCY|nr:hypothetical protein M413DRAFT_390198 [Hebeloma cylindrosporum h7]
MPASAQRIQLSRLFTKFNAGLIFYLHYYLSCGRLIEGFSSQRGRVQTHEASRIDYREMCMYLLTA